MAAWQKQRDYSNRINDGSSNAPALDIQQSWWAMIGLGENGKEWSMEMKFEKIAEAGFTTIVSWLPPKEEMDTWHRLLDRYRLNFAGLAFPRTPQDMLESLKPAKEFGRVQYLNAQVMDAFVIGDEAVRLLDDLLRAAEEANIPTMIETHRGTVTQDLIRTAEYVKALPHLRLTIDLSHYVVAGELHGTSEMTNAKSEALFDQLLQRTSGLHARVSNGEQVQIDVGADGDHPMVERFAGWWRKGIGYWLQQAQPGDRLPFCMELGPPIYAITRRDEHGREVEVSDRWQQALLLKRIVETEWAHVQREHVK